MSKLSQTLIRSTNASEYLQKVKYHDLINWIMVETFVAYAKACKDKDEDALKELENPSKFIHTLIKTRLLQRSDECITATQDLEGLAESQKNAFQKSQTIHWTSNRPKTAYSTSNTFGKVAQVRAVTAPVSTASEWPSDIKMLKAEKRKWKDGYETAAERVKELKAKLKELQEAAGVEPS